MVLPSIHHDLFNFSEESIKNKFDKWILMMYRRNDEEIRDNIIKQIQIMPLSYLF